MKLTSSSPCFWICSLTSVTTSFFLFFFEVVASVERLRQLVSRETMWLDVSRSYFVSVAVLPLLRFVCVLFAFRGGLFAFFGATASESLLSTLGLVDFDPDTQELEVSPEIWFLFFAGRRGILGVGVKSPIEQERD
jgi:hypothetical protein